MEKLIQKINKIPKNYFSLTDIRKIAGAKDASLKVAMARLVKNKSIAKIGGGYYSLSPAKIDWEKFALEIYQPSYLSFESALAKYGILNQKPHGITLATTKRSKTIDANMKSIIYHHINPTLFWGFKKEDNILIAEPEKAFLDLAYLSLNGYARFDSEEMNIDFLNRKKIIACSRKFKSKKLENLINREMSRAKKKSNRG